MVNIHDMIQKAQATKDPKIYEKIAYMYIKGNGVPKDEVQALAYYRIAADLGSVQSQAYTGILYYRGCGTGQNIKLAKQYLKVAADRGSIDALFELGRMCYKGDYGFLTSKGKAFEYWMKASKLGHVQSQIYVATSYLGDTWGAEKSFKKASFWFMCACQNRKATREQIHEAKGKLNMLAEYVDLDRIKDEIIRKYPEYLNM